MGYGEHEISQWFFYLGTHYARQGLDQVCVFLISLCTYIYCLQSHIKFILIDFLFHQVHFKIESNSNEYFTYKVRYDLFSSDRSTNEHPFLFFICADHNSFKLIGESIQDDMEKWSTCRSLSTVVSWQFQCFIVHMHYEISLSCEETKW